MGRDFQRTKVYRAEGRVRDMQAIRTDTFKKLEKAHPSCEGPPSPMELCGPLLNGPEEAQALIDRVIREHYPALPATITFVTDGRRTSRASAGCWRPGEWQIRYPRPPWPKFFACTLLLLHEIAHCLDPYDHHGPTFTAFYVHLVDTYIGPEASKALRHEFTVEGVRVGKLKIEKVLLSDREGEK
jgi:putative metallohydrolase (TIGR04338 family)